MPQRYGEGEILIAQEVLQGNRMLYWCILCGRPRRKNYCPVAARTGKARHNVVLRSTISPNDQLASYLFQGPVIADKED